MNSNCIYIPKTDRTPYFYIIQHIASGKFYAGSKYGKDADPSTFMQPTGYCTSSNKIKRIIKEEGLEAFSIYRLMTETECGVDVYYYETQFLRENKISQRDNWFNTHNNTIHKWGDVAYRFAMIKIIGSEFPQQSPIIQEQTKETNLINLGYEYTFLSPIVQAKSAATIFKNWGVTNAMKSPIIQERFKQSFFKIYGVTNPGQLVRPLIECKYCKQKHSLNNINRAHNEKCKMSPANLAASELEKSIKDAHYLRILTCIHCGFVGTKIGSMIYHHNDNCKHNPNRPKQKEFSCCHCSFVGTKGHVGRWHNDNCKHNPNKHAQLANQKADG